MKLKRIIGFLTALVGIGVFSVCTYAATFSVEDVSGSAGDTVEVKVYINPDTDGTEETLNGFTMNLTYDSSVLTPVVVGTDELDKDLYATAADSLSSGILVSDTSTTGTLVVGWAARDAITYSEKTQIFTATFTIDSTATGSSDVSLAVTSLTTDGSTIITDSTELAAYDTAGTVTISSSSFIRGDANDDNVVDISDVNTISQYLVSLITSDDINLDKADANEDGDVDVSDVNTVAQSLI